MYYLDVKIKEVGMDKDRVDLILDQWKIVRPDLDPSPMAVFGRMARLHAFFSKEIQAVFAAHGLPPGGFDVLATLRRAGGERGLTPKELLDWMMITSGTMTNRLDQLEKAGLIARGANPEDGRGVIVTLTDSGRTIVDRAVAAHVENERRLLAPLSGDEQVQLAGLLRRWLAGLEI